MRWKLANGNTVATTKQPVQWKDFDRVEITDDYQDWYEANGTFSDNGGAPLGGEVEFCIKYYNPSTHSIRKSYSQGQDKLSITFGIDTLGHTGGSYSKKDPYIYKDFKAILSELDYGYVCEYYVYPPLVYIQKHYSHTVNPFVSNWYSTEHNIPEDRSIPPCDNYEHDTYIYKYEVQFRQGMTGGGPQPYHGKGHKVLHRIPHQIEYKIH